MKISTRLAGWSSAAAPPGRAWGFKADTPDKRHVGSRFYIVHCDDVLYFGTQEDGHLYAVDRKGGGELWRLELGGTFYGPFSNTNKSLLIVEETPGGHGLNLKAIDLSSRQVALARDDIVGLPTLLAGVLYIPIRSGTLAGLDATTGKEVWRLGSGGGR